MRSAFLFLALFLIGLPMMAPAQSIQGRTVRLSLPAQTPIPNQGIYDVPPELGNPAAQKRTTQATHLSRDIPIRPGSNPETLPPLNPPTDAPSSFAPGDFNTFRQTTLSPPSTSSINEPSLGVNGRVVFYSGNWFAGFSGDGGQTFSYLNPTDNFPADGIPDMPPNAGGFCCDQVVYYEPTRGLMIWLLQYNRTGNSSSDTNIQRIAIANSQADVLNNNWYWYDFTPGDLGLPATDWWLDFPDLAVSNNFLYFTSNAFKITGTQSTAASVVVRLSLDQLAAGGSITGTAWNLAANVPRPAHGSAFRMYFAVHLDNEELWVYHVSESSNTMEQESIDHAAYNPGTRGNMSAPGPDGNDFALRADSRVLGGWKTGNEIGFAWHAQQGGSFPYPYVRFIRINRTNWDVIQEVDVWNPGFAWMYPSVHVNDRGHLGGMMAFGGGSNHANAAAWIVDDFSSPAFPNITGMEVLTVTQGTNGPADDEWGDYLTTRRMVPYGNTWAGSGFMQSGGSADGNATPRYIWFGRERDMPPSSHIIHVDLTNSTGYEDGSQAHPYNTVNEGNIALQPLDLLLVQSATYNENVVFRTQAEVRGSGGAVIIR